MKWPLWLYRVVPYLGRRQAEADLQEELRLHLELDRERQAMPASPRTLPTGPRNASWATGR